MKLSIAYGKSKLARCKKKAIIQLISFRDFFLELANCKKYLVGGLHGRVIGIGVAMLPYFDVTYAADKTVFHLPYAALGQCTEGASGYACRVTSKGTQAVRY